MQVLENLDPFAWAGRVGVLLRIRRAASRFSSHIGFLIRSESEEYMENI